MTPRPRFPLALVLFLALGIYVGLNTSDRLPRVDDLLQPDRYFIERPYLQIGSAGPDLMMLTWSTHEVPAAWRVAVRVPPGRWRDMEAPDAREVALDSVEPYRQWSVALTGLVPGRPFHYRVLREGAVVCEATAVARKPSAQPCRFVVFGDCGTGSRGQRDLALRMAEVAPDFAFVVGDIAYRWGRVLDYRRKFFPVYDADRLRPGFGAPLMRSVPFIAAVGNHDTDNVQGGVMDMDAFPDALAYFLFWMQPLNGPRTVFAPRPSGSAAHVAAFQAAAADRWPRMATFSFDYGPAHWTVLDSNDYVDWNDAALRAWLAADLASARRAAWRIVAFHHAPFHSSTMHAEEQQMRRVAPILQDGGVDIVFAGHVHVYERTRPLLFHADTGAFEVDEQYDGKKVTRPHGIVYVVTGAAGLGGVARRSPYGTFVRHPYSRVFDARHPSFTRVDLDAKRMRVRQVDNLGQEVDRFDLQK